MSTICVIILNYFNTDKTRHCLESLLGQGVDTVCVVDNSADSAERAELKEMLSTIRESACDYSIIEMLNEENLGFAKGVNAALAWLQENSRHQFYCVLNNDSTISPGSLSLMLDYLGKNPETVMVAPVIVSGDTIYDGFWYQSMTGLQFKRKVAGAFQYFSGCCLVLRNEMCTGKLFDEDFFMYGEDVELSWRLLSMQKKIASLADARVYHEGTGSSTHGGFFYEYHVARSHILLATKLAGSRFEGAVMLLLHTLTLMFRAVVRCVRYRSLVPLVVVPLSFFDMKIRVKKKIGAGATL